jgi:hypothetical protein
MLHRDEIAELAERYRREAGRRRAAPRPAETKRRLDALRKGAAVTLAALAELGPEDAEAFGLMPGDIERGIATAQEFGDRATAATRPTTLGHVAPTEQAASAPTEADSFWSGILAAIHGPKGPHAKDAPRSAVEPRQTPTWSAGTQTSPPSAQAPSAASHGFVDMGEIAKRVATEAGYSVGPGKPRS